MTVLVVTSTDSYSEFSTHVCSFPVMFTLLASPGNTKIHVEFFLTKNVCFGFSFRTTIALALQTNAIRVAFSISLHLVETQNMLATSRRSFVALALVAAPLIRHVT